MSPSPLAPPPRPRPLQIHYDRKGMGLILFDVARAVHCSESTLSRLERGQVVNPDLEKRVKAFLAAQRKARS